MDEDVCELIKNFFSIDRKRHRRKRICGEVSKVLVGDPLVSKGGKDSCWSTIKFDFKLLSIICLSVAAGKLELFKVIQAQCFDRFDDLLVC